MCDPACQDKVGCDPCPHRISAQKTADDSEGPGGGDMKKLLEKAAQKGPKIIESPRTNDESGEYHIWKKRWNQRLEPQDQAGGSSDKGYMGLDQ